MFLLFSHGLEADERNGLRVDVNGNPNYEPEPGMPSTPPPSYSVIERQTSYVSHISVSSSQSEYLLHYDLDPVFQSQGPSNYNMTLTLYFSVRAL